MRTIRAWLRSWVRRRDEADAEMRAEFDFHLQQRADALKRNGLSDRAAQRQARVDFGSRAVYIDRGREASRWLALADVAGDLRIALRVARRHFGSTLVLILTLTLGLGATTAVFSMVETVFLRPLPVLDPQRLVLFSGDDMGGSIHTSPPPDGVWSAFSSDAFRSFHASPSTFTAMAAFAASYDTVTTGLPSEPVGRRASVSLVSGNYFDVLGVSARFGRCLTDHDDALDARPAAVVSDGFWRATLHADPHALGGVILVNGTAFTVVGVMPSAFYGVRVRSAPDLWIPLAWQPGVQLDRPARLRPNHYWLNIIGRLAPGQSIGSAQVAMTQVLRRFLLSTAGASPDEATLARVRRTDLALVEGGRGLAVLRGRYLEPLTLMFAVVALLLLLTCANVATLLLCRADARRTEVAVRRALGAGPGRLLRQWFTESLLLAAAGIGGGLVLSHWAVGILGTYFYTGPVDATLNGRVIAFALVTSFGACVLFGLAPARYLGRIDDLVALRSKTPHDRSRRKLGGRDALLISQAALSFVLVAGAALFGQTLFNLEHEPLGFSQDHVLLLRINPRDAGYSPADVGILYGRMYDVLSKLPGVDRVSYASYSPFSGHTSLTGATVDGYTPLDGKQLDLESVLVGPNYPETLGLTILAGRAIGAGDRAGTERVAMVNETFAREFFPASSPIGHHLHFRDDYRIIGVVGDARFHAARETAKPFVFTSMLQQTDPSALECEIELRTRGDALPMAAPVRQAVLAIDSHVAPGRPETLRAHVLNAFGPERIVAGFAGVLALLALMVAGVGLYGVVAHSVARRTRELGIRMSLGASHGAVVALLLGDIAVPVAVGLAIGIVSTVVLAQTIRAQLFGIGALPSLVLAIAATIFSGVAVIASLVPAARVLRVPPTAALQSD